MNFYMLHGRLDPDGQPENPPGSPVDDWGFDGPRLEGVIGFHCTYGTSGYFNVFFEDWKARAIAQAQTGWEAWEDNALTARFSSDDSLLVIKDRISGRDHYFGDWGIK